MSGLLLFSDFLLPETAPVPISSTWDGGSLTGSITFDRPLDQTVVLVGGDFARGFGSVRREAATLNYSGSSTIEFTSLTAGAFDPLVLGWAYFPNVNKIKGLTGLEVVGFTGFMVGE